MRSEASGDDLCGVVSSARPPCLTGAMRAEPSFGRVKSSLGDALPGTSRPPCHRLQGDLCETPGRLTRHGKACLRARTGVGQKQSAAADSRETASWLVAAALCQVGGKAIAISSTGLQVQNADLDDIALTEIPHCHRFLAAALFCHLQTTSEVSHG